MGLAARLKQIELKLRPVTIVPERLFDIDQCIVHLGLDPVAVVSQLATSAEVCRSNM